jgi:glycosyltransferase involved in cell wall biosynthesis
MTYNHADSIACTSPKQIELLSERGVPRERLFHVPMWVDETLFFPSPRDHDLAKRLGVQDKTVLLYAGALGEPQGLETLLEACARLKEERRFHCLIAGTGVAESRLRAQAAELKLANVTFLGTWPIQDMTRLMSIGDVHLVSLRSDPLAAIALPSKVLSTLACGKPMIAAAEGEAARVVNESAAGWTCSPGDSSQLEAALREALAVGASQLQAMGRRGREVYVEQFAVEIGVERVEQLLAGGATRQKVAV